ncbi:transglycosylase SLT domain-containing protein [Porticoccus sp. GXU_MW_L64]
MRLSVKNWLAGAALLQSMELAALEDIPLAYLVVAKSVEVPADILYSVALAESARPYRQQPKPWPWTLNINGQGIYCDSREDALHRLTDAIRRNQLVDIGLMQINWHWHKQRFASPNDALLPMHNLKAGAQVLREQYNNTGEWWQAVGRYHDPGQDKTSRAAAANYRQRVKQHWQANFQ